MAASASSEQRWRLRARGAVQGVGFRPWCVQQAARLGLCGWVRNDTQGVLAEVQGAPEALQRFADAWRDCPLPTARVVSVEQQRLDALVPPPGSGLRILASEDAGPQEIGRAHV